MKIFYFRMVVFIASLFIISCDNEAIPVTVEIFAPTVETLVATSDSNGGYIEINGRVVDGGGGKVYEKGFNLSLQPEPNISKIKWIVPDTDSALFSMIFYQYEKNRTYYIRAYAINESGIGYGRVIELFTSTKASVKTGSAKVLNNTRVELFANVNSYSSDVEVWFEVWSENEAIRKIKVNSNGALTNTDVNAVVSGLTPGESYYYNVKVKNSHGISTGKDSKFVLPYEIVNDYDGNEYWTYKIGGQVWLAENLKTTHFMNGDPIPEVTPDKDWLGMNKPAYCYYSNDQQIGKRYGAIYNTYVGLDPRGLINGYNVPLIIDYKILTEHLGGPDVAAKQLRSNTDDWVENTKGNNSSGLNAMPGGWRGDDGSFNGVGYYTVFQTTSLYPYRIPVFCVFVLRRYNVNGISTAYAFEPFQGSYIRLIKSNYQN